MTKYIGSERDVTIPEGETKIGDRAFYGCAGLKRVRLPAGLEEIGAEAFAGCPKLKLSLYPTTQENGRALAVNALKALLESRRGEADAE